VEALSRSASPESRFRDIPPARRTNNGPVRPEAPLNLVEISAMFGPSSPPGVRAANPGSSTRHASLSLTGSTIARQVGGGGGLCASLIRIGLDEIASKIDTPRRVGRACRSARSDRRRERGEQTTVKRAAQRYDLVLLRRQGHAPTARELESPSSPRLRVAENTLSANELRHSAAASRAPGDCCTDSTC